MYVLSGCRLHMAEARGQASPVKAIQSLYCFLSSNRILHIPYSQFESGCELKQECPGNLPQQSWFRRLDNANAFAALLHEELSVRIENANQLTEYTCTDFV